MHEEKKQPYRAYLLRCWQEGAATPSQAPTWRFYVEEILHERCPMGFSSLGALFAFLQAELVGSEEKLSDDTEFRLKCQFSDIMTSKGEVK